MTIDNAWHGRVSSLLAPRSVVVLGASNRRHASGNEALANLRARNYPAAQIHVVHPSAQSIDGYRAVQTIADVPVAPDVALVSLPSRAVVSALRELDAHGCRGAILPTAGFNPEEMRDLEEFIETSEMLVHGHNCMGILNVADDIPLWFYDGLLVGLPRGPIALVSQSGSATFLTRAVEGMGFSRVISTGNEIGITSADYLEWLAQDPASAVVGLVIESISDTDRFISAVRSLRVAGKPLVVLKVGRTPGGQRAAMAHTGALVSDDSAFRSFFDLLDVPLVEDYDELATTLQVLATPGLPEACGSRIAVITDSGGEAGLTADIADRRRIPLAQFSAPTVARLSELVPVPAILNPLDAGASPATTDDGYAEAFRVAALDEDVDSVLVVSEMHASMTTQEIEYGVEVLGDAIRAAHSAGKPVLVACSSSTATHPLARRLLAPVPVVRGISNGLVALAAAGRNREQLVMRGMNRPAHLKAPDDLATLRRELSDADGVADGDLSARILAGYGIPRTSSTIVQDADAAVVWAAGRYPVVAKIQSRDISHRSDAGGVVVGIEDEPGLRRALDLIRENVATAAPDARIEGFEIQVHVGDSFEAMIGVVGDPQLGPTIVVGSGGVLVELLADTATALAPVSSQTADDLLRSTRLVTLMDGYRSLAPRTSRAALLDVVERVGWLAHDLDGVLAELDLNPVFVQHDSGEVRIVDVLIVGRQAAAHTELVLAADR